MFRRMLVILLFLFSYALMSPRSIAEQLHSGKSPVLSYTGTFLKRGKSSTRGYPENIVVQPTFLAQSLPGGHLKFLVFTQSGGIHNDHIGFIEGTVKLRAGRATFKQGTYVLHIQFRPGLVDLSESGDPMDGGCGVGACVTGRYFLKSSRRPDFRKAEEDWG